MYAGECQIGDKIDALVGELSNNDPTVTSASDYKLLYYSEDLEKQFLILLKYLAFGAFRTPVPQMMVKKIQKIVNEQSSATTIQKHMFWTPPQINFLARQYSNNNMNDKVLFVGGNGVGKTILAMEQAKQLLLQNQKVLFCIEKTSGSEKVKSLLQLKLEEQFQEVNPGSNRIVVKGIGSINDLKHEKLSQTHVFIDEGNEKLIDDFEEDKNFKPSSIWLILGNFKNVPVNMDNYEAVMQELKQKYPDWFMPYFNLTLRTSRNIAQTYTEEEKQAFKGTEDESNSKLNRCLSIPEHAQDGPMPKSNPPGDTFTQRLETGLTNTNFLQFPDNNILLAFYCGEGKFTPEEIDSALLTCQVQFPKLHELATKDTGRLKNHWVRLCITVSTLLKCNRKLPLIWLSDQDYKSIINKVNSDENEVKKWMKGESDCDLITDYPMVQGTEFSTVIYITNAPKKQESDRFKNVITRSMVQYLEIQG